MVSAVLFVRTAWLGSHLKAVLLSQDARVDRFDDGVLIQSEVQRLCGAAGRQQGLMGVGLFEALHQTGPERKRIVRCGEETQWCLFIEDGLPPPSSTQEHKRHDFGPNKVILC